MKTATIEIPGPILHEAIRASSNWREHMDPFWDRLKEHAVTHKVERKEDFDIAVLTISGDDDIVTHEVTWWMTRIMEHDQRRKQD
jgi:hypothetical protein